MKYRLVRHTRRNGNVLYSIQMKGGILPFWRNIHNGVDGFYPFDNRCNRLLHIFGERANGTDHKFDRYYGYRNSAELDFGLILLLEERIVRGEHKKKHKPEVLLENEVSLKDMFIEKV